MRRLLSTALVLAPVVSALVHPDLLQSEPAADHSFAYVAVDTVIDDFEESRDWFPDVLGFRLDIYPSKEACGDANFTLDGQILPMKNGGEVLAGKGPIITKDKLNLDASWKVDCITVNGKPDAQFLKFHINAVEGRRMIGVGFSALFRQTGNTEIIQINTDLMMPDLIAANPDPEALVPTDAAVQPLKHIHEEFKELEWLMAQMQELQVLISEKKQIIADHASDHFQEDIKHCDSLLCVITAVAEKVKNAAHEVYEKIAWVGEFEHRPSHHDRPHQGPLDHGRGTHADHLPRLPHHPPYGPHHGPPKHHNGTPPQKPHHWLPICRMPHHRKNHHGPPHGPPRHGPPIFKPHLPPHGPPPHHGRPEFPPPPPFNGQGRFQDGSEDDNWLPLPHHESEPFPPPHGSDHGRVFGQRPLPRRFGRISHIIRFLVIGFVAAFLFAALRHRVCTPKRKAGRKARREARRERRRSVHKNLISRLLARIAGSNDLSDNCAEKRAALVSDLEDGRSSTMGEEIEQLQNAASVVDDMVCHEEGRARETVQFIPETLTYTHAHPLISHTQPTTPSIQGYNLPSPDIYDELPTYVDEAASDVDSMTSDGFRYTPTSSRYTPSNSDGSASDILGPDTKS